MKALFMIALGVTIFSTACSTTKLTETEVKELQEQRARIMSIRMSKF